MENKDIISVKSKEFALKIIETSLSLTREKKEFVLSRQVLKSGTSIGANIREAKYSESKQDFIHKYKIALKEANETIYWLELLFESELIGYDIFNELSQMNIELLKLLTSSINTLSKRSDN